MQEVRRLIGRAARTLSTVLITGETGVGKELVAQEIHRRGRTRDQAWVPVNCAALPAELVESLLFGHERGAFTGADRARKGKVQEAQGGTLFLDEVGELPLATQAKLLRVLQERVVEPLGGAPQPVQLRVIAATHRDLAAEVAAGRFREDLFYRLSVLVIAVPSLRQRRGEVPGLVRELLVKVAGRIGVPVPRVRRELLEYLSGCEWPGNVRELENLLEEMLVLEEAETLDLDSLPRRFRKQSFLEAFRLPPEPQEAEPVAPRPAGSGEAPAGSLKQRLDACEKRFLEEALVASGGRKKEAAEALGISARAMSYYVRKHQLR